MPTRRIAELVLVMLVAWEGAKVLPRLWVRKTWAATQPGSPAHETADVVSVFVR